MHALENTSTLYQILSQKGVNAQQYIVYNYHNTFKIRIIILCFLLNVSYKVIKILFSTKLVSVSWRWIEYNSLQDKYMLSQWASTI